LQKSTLASFWTKFWSPKAFLQAIDVRDLTKIHVAILTSNLAFNTRIIACHESC